MTDSSACIARNICRTAAVSLRISWFTRRSYRASCGPGTCKSASIRLAPRQVAATQRTNASKIRPPRMGRVVDQCFHLVDGAVQCHEVSLQSRNHFAPCRRSPNRRCTPNTRERQVRFRTREPQPTREYQNARHVAVTMFNLPPRTTRGAAGFAVGYKCLNGFSSVIVRHAWPMSSAVIWPRCDSSAASAGSLADASPRTPRRACRDGDALPARGSRDDPR